MKKEKLIEDTHILHQFITMYCVHQHKEVLKKEGSVEMLSYTLCEECEHVLHYAHARLCECPHDPKPSCRKCHKPCYEREMWKKMARVMMYSGMRLGLTKMRKLFFK
jgi:hypothetical protein